MDCDKFQSFSNSNFKVARQRPLRKRGGGGDLIENTREMADTDSMQNSQDSQLKRENIELPDCFPCKIIGAGACFGSSAYLLIKRNTFGQTPAARSAIGIVAAGM